MANRRRWTTLPGFDDRLTAELERAARPADPTGVLERVSRRRSRRAALRKVKAGLLAVAVLAATTAGFVALREAFGENGRDVGESPTLAANGVIVFSREGVDGHFHLYASQPDGSGVRQITDDATNDTDPTVSPGGETIAYVHELDREIPKEVSKADPPDPGIHVIATVPIEGGVVSWHTPDELFASDPAWSPDGTQIAFVGQRGTSSHLYVVGVDSLEPEPLTSPLDVQVADPTWSPDGTRIAFALRGPAGPWGLASIRPDGTGLEPLRTPDDDEEAPAWFPDGSRIAFLRTGNEVQEIWTVDPEGGSPQLAARALETTLQTELAWAPNGSALLASDGEWILRVDPSPAGDPNDNFVELVKGTSPAWQPLPAGSLLSPTPTPEPTVSPGPQPASRDIGLGFPLCNIQRLSGIDWFGDGREGTAWTARRLEDDSRCPTSDDTSFDDDSTLVVADLDADGLADTWTSIVFCISCQPWATIDLDANGAEELVVLFQGGTTPQYGFFYAVPEGLPRASGIYSLFIEGPGAPVAGFATGTEVTVWAGGDEADSYAIRCEAYPEDPVLVAASLHAPVDTDIREIHVTRLRLVTSRDLVDAHVVVLDSTSGTDANEDWGGDAKACGVDFNPWA